MSSNPEPGSVPVPATQPSPAANGALDLLDALEFAVQDTNTLSFDPLPVRARLARRAAASVRANRAVITVRHAAAAMARANGQARLQTLYLAAAGALRPGEPLHVLLIELAPGGRLLIDAPAPGVQREWLLLRGKATLIDRLKRIALDPLDFHVAPAATPRRLDEAMAAPPAPPLTLMAEASGALLFLHESLQAADPGQAALTLRDADTPWMPYAPLVERRVLWQRGSLASLLYRAEPGAQVPQHLHGHDEECLVLRGETQLDDCLLREGDYQLAPAGSSHPSASTEVGSIFYIHGDLNLDLTMTAAAASAA